MSEHGLQGSRINYSCVTTPQDLLLFLLLLPHVRVEKKLTTGVYLTPPLLPPPPATLHHHTPLPLHSQLICYFLESCMDGEWAPFLFVLQAVQLCVCVCARTWLSGRHLDKHVCVWISDANPKHLETPAGPSAHIHICLTWPTVLSSSWHQTQMWV